MNDNIIPEQLKPLSEKLNLHYFNNALLYDFIPYKHSDFTLPNPKDFDAHSASHQDWLNLAKMNKIINWSPVAALSRDEAPKSTSGEYIYEFDKDIIYFVCVNTFSPDLGHNMTELFVLYQIYENYFKNLVIPGKKIKILTMKSYIDYEGGYLPSYLKYTSLNSKDWLIAPKDGKAFYRGNFIFKKVLNYCQNFNVSNTLNRSFFTLNNELIIKANEKYKGEPFCKRLFISRGENWDTYWHKRFCTNINDEKIKKTLNKYGFNKKVLPPKKEKNMVDDFLYQVYLMNNVEIIFTVPGKAFINIFFMKKGAKYLTLFPTSIPTYNKTPINVAACHGINIKIYMETELDKNNKWANHHNDSNLPYKIKNVDHFINGLDESIDS